MTTSVLDKLARVCEMMTSNHESERAVAARMATGILRDLDLTWTQLIHRALGPAHTFSSQQYDQEQSDRSQPTYPRPDFGKNRTDAARTTTRNGVSVDQWLRELIKREEQLNSWERKFIRALMSFSPNITLTQSQWRQLENAAERIGLRMET